MKVEVQSIENILIFLWMRPNDLSLSTETQLFRSYVKLLTFDRQTLWAFSNYSFMYK